MDNLVRWVKMRTRIWSMSAANRAQLPMDNHLATSQLMGEKKLPMMLITVMRVNRMLVSRTYKKQTRSVATRKVLLFEILKLLFTLDPP